MAYETKVLLISIAEMALVKNSRDMYEYIAKLANAEGVILKSWDEAKADIEKK